MSQVARLPSLSKESAAVEQGWYYVIEPRPGELPAATKTVSAEDGRTLTRKLHGARGRFVVTGPRDLPWAGLLRVAYASGESMPPGLTDETVWVDVNEGSDPPRWRTDDLTFGQAWLRTNPSLQHLSCALKPAFADATLPKPRVEPVPSTAKSRVLFFESIMSSEMEHNEAEISQGVLHMASALREVDGVDVDFLFAQVKMPIVGDDRPVQGLDDLGDLIRDEPIHLICITLLEGYWEGALQLIRGIRETGCRARIAVGGVMPTLTPEHVAAHLPEVTYICRGAGEYFLPHLVRIAGQQTVDEPLSDAQLHAFSMMDGLIVRESVGERRALVSGRADRTPKVEDLDAVTLDLGFVAARHLIHGLEISTSRGCIHKCTFCNIIGRESYQARSTESVLELLSRYADRYQELFGDQIPHTAYRLHIADDDFACDKPRAAQFFNDILETPFRLSSVQVSVADLCLHEDGALQPVLDPALCDAIRPECFADFYRNIPVRDFIHDHESRNWSAYLQIGVETFSDRELIRLGKGYRVPHIRAAVDGLTARGIHVDAYFIQSNSETSAEDLLEGLTELVRLKIRHPTHFHVRFPPVRHLVSYFPAATHRRHIRKGVGHVHKLRGEEAVEGYPEYDYPRVDHDLPTDPWVKAAVDGDFFQGGAAYTESLVRLHEIWTAHAEALTDPDERQRAAVLLRQLDDLPRRLLFARLKELKELRSVNDSPQLQAQEQIAFAITESALGKARDWKIAFQRYMATGTMRMVLIPTWQCELRCKYCFIPKQDGRVMDGDTARKAIDRLLTTHRKRILLQFFGGEALLEWDTVKACIAYAHDQAKRTGVDLSFIVSSNGWSLHEDRVQWLSQYPVKLELSLDGDADTMNRSRKALVAGEDSYANGISPKADFIQASGLFHEVIMVVPPDMAPKLAHNFMHIADQGWKRIQINFGLGYMWKTAELKVFAEELMKVGEFLKERWRVGDPIALVNLEHRPMPMRLNGEITVDYDGSIHAGNAFLVRGRPADELVLGWLDDHQNFDRLWMDAPEHDVLLDSTYSEKVTANNLEVGKIFQSFIRYMQAARTA
ncbi:MAG: radical SAM protein [Myxococcota bacterium]|nr:radical SAM protein [Myxococcota bacterium]